MARITGVDPETAEGYVAAVVEAQRKRYGAPLENYLIYARCPEILKAVRGMWAALDASGKLSPRLAYLLNVRVAGLVGCPF